jgi:hypothetical protein
MHCHRKKKQKSGNKQINLETQLDLHQSFYIPGAINGPACIELFPIDSRTKRRFSSQARSALSS